MAAQQGDGQDRERSPRRSAEGNANTRLSVWTVIGSACASIITAVVLQGGSGVLQIPALSSDNTTTKAQMATVLASQQELTVRSKGNELQIDNLKALFSDLSARMQSQNGRMDKKDSDDRGLDQQTQRDLQAIRVTDQERAATLSATLGALRADVLGVQDRVRSQGEAIRSLYDLSVRPPNQSPRQPQPGRELFPPPAGSPLRDPTSLRAIPQSALGPVCWFPVSELNTQTRELPVSPSQGADVDQLKNRNSL